MSRVSGRPDRPTQKNRSIGGRGRRPKAFALVLIFLIEIYGFGEKVGVNVVGPVEAGTPIRPALVGISKLSDTSEQHSILVYRVGLGFGNGESGLGCERHAPTVWQNSDPLVSYGPLHRINSWSFINLPITIPESDFGRKKTECCVRIAGIDDRKCYSDWAVWYNRVDLELAHNDHGPMGSEKFVSRSVDGAPQLNSLPYEYASLDDAYNGEGGGRIKQELSEASDFVIGRRLFEFFVLLAGGVVCNICGWKYFYNQRRVLGSALVICGGIIALGGLGLWWLTLFAWSWSWLL